MQKEFRQEVVPRNRVPRVPVWIPCITLLLGLVLGAVVASLPYDAPPQPRVVHSPLLDADLIGQRTDPYNGPTYVLGCLTLTAPCTTLWLPYHSIDEIAALSYGEPYGVCLSGCLLINFGDGWTCTRRVFYLSYTRLLR